MGNFFHKNRIYVMELSKLNIQNQENNQSVVGYNIVGDIMWPIILFLKIFGHSPLSYEAEQTGDNPIPGTGRVVKIYKIRLGSLFVAWSTISAVWIISSMLYFLKDNWAILNDDTEHVNNRTNVWRDIIQNQKKIGSPFPQSIVITIKTLLALIPIIHVSELFLEWAESGSLAKFLNAWARIQNEFQSVFACSSTLITQWYINLKKIRNRLIFVYVIIPTTLFLPPFLILNESSIYILFTTVIPCAFTISAVAAMEDFRVIMTYRILAEALRQIREGMLYTMTLERLTSNKIWEWRNLVQSVRQQVQQSGESQKSHQLLLIGGSIVLITGSVFVLLHIPFNNPTPQILTVTGIWVGFVCTQLVKLYGKILAGNEIVREENQIASDLALMDTDEDNLSIQLEIKLFHNMMASNPSVICFGNYVSLDNGLMLGVTSQVVTYLIVLMQFTR